jgi:hypothetical protein
MASFSPLPIIIHRYVNQCQTVAQPPGLADFLKGTVYLYQQSKRGQASAVAGQAVAVAGQAGAAFVLLVDFSHHPMGVFIQPPTRPLEHQALVAAAAPLTECFNQYRPVIRDIVATIQQTPQNAPPVTYAICHEPYDRFDENTSVLSTDDQAFMKSVLTFHEELYELADQIQEDLGIGKEYVVVHLRMGDQQSAHTTAYEEQLNDVIRCLETELIPRWGKRILVLSDSYYTKQFLKTKYGLACTDFTPVHMGESARFLNRGQPASLTEIGHTLTEFILMSRSQAIYIYSVYGWCSGFSKLAAHIYGIPYISMTPGDT